MYNSFLQTIVPDNTTESGVMSIDELAEYLQVGKSTAYNLLRSGSIKGFKIGSIWKVSKTAVDSYIYEMSKK